MNSQHLPVFKSLISKEISDYAEWLNFPPNYDALIYYNPEIHANKNETIKRRERIIELINRLHVNQRSLYLMELQIAELKARKRHLKAKENKTLEDYQTIIDILEKIRAQYEGLYNYYKVSLTKNSKLITLFSNKASKLEDNINIAKNEREIFFHKEAIKNAYIQIEQAKKIASTSTDTALDIDEKIQRGNNLYRGTIKTIEGHTEKIEELYKDTFKVHESSGKSHSKKLLRSIYSANPKLKTFSTTHDLSHILDNPNIKNCLDEISRSFKYWFNPTRFLNNLEKLSYHINKALNISSYEIHHKFTEILSIYFKRIPPKEFQNFYIKFKTKAYPLTGNLDAFANDINGSSESSLASRLLQLLNNVNENLDKIASDELKDHKFINAFNSKNYENDIINLTLKQIISRMQQRPVTAPDSPSHSLTWSQHITSKDTKSLFPDIHNKTMRFSETLTTNLMDLRRTSSFLDLSSIIQKMMPDIYKELNIGSADLVPKVGPDNRIVKPACINLIHTKKFEKLKAQGIAESFLDTENENLLVFEKIPLPTNSGKNNSHIVVDSTLNEKSLDPIEKILVSLSKNHAGLTNFLLTQLSENHLLSASTKALEEHLTLNKNLIPKTELRKFILIPLQNGKFLCQTIRDIKQLRDSTTAKPVIYNPSNEPLATFDTTYLISPAGKNEVKITVTEHNSYFYHAKLKDYIDSPSSVMHSSHNFIMA